MILLNLSSLTYAKQYIHLTSFFLLRAPIFPLQKLRLVLHRSLEVMPC